MWIINFYNPKEEKSKKTADLWKELATKFYGIFKVAAVDCLNEEELCEDEFGVTKTPEVWAFPANSDLDAERFTGEFKESEFANFAVKFMESFV